MVGNVGIAALQGAGDLAPKPAAETTEGGEGEKKGGWGAHG